MYSEVPEVPEVLLTVSFCHAVYEMGLHLFPWIRRVLNLFSDLDINQPDGKSL